MRDSWQVRIFLPAICALGLAACGTARPPLSPRKSLKTFQLSPGFRIELVAAEPDVASPVAMAFDERGRLFVVEMPDYPLKREPLGRVVMLEDRDGDGRFEHRTVFADHLHFPNGVMAWNGGILVSCAPDILYFRDTDGDGRADVRRVVLTGFAATNPQLRVNGLAYGLDNWIYAAYPRVSRPSVYVQEFGDQGRPITFPEHPQAPPLEIHAADLRFRLDKPKAEIVAGNSEYGNTFDEWGHRFTVWNNDHVRYCVIPNECVNRNAWLPLESSDSISDHERAAKVFGITQRLEYIHDSELGRFTSACGISVYTADLFPPEYRGHFFVCEPASNLVHRDALVPSGATLVARRARQGVEFLASTDGWFRPVFTTVGPDGALYVVDYYRQVIEHPEWIPPEMLKELNLYAGAQRGRIYRVVPDSFRPGPKPKLNETTSSELVAHLAQANLWWRITAQRLLVERQDRSAVPALLELAVRGVPAAGRPSSSSPERLAVARIHALWTLDGLGALGRDLVLQALGDPDAHVREQAIRLAQERLPDRRLMEKLLGMTEDPDVRVQLQLAAALGGLPDDRAFAALQRMAMGHMEDRWFRGVALSAAGEDAGRWCRTLLAKRDFVESPSEGKKDFLAQLASIIGARQKEAEVRELLELMSRQARGAAWLRGAGLHGLALGLRRGSKGPIRLAAAQDSVLRMLDSPALEVRTAALAVAGRLELRETAQLRAALKNAVRDAKNSGAAEPQRLFAIGVLGLDPSSSTAPLLESFLTPQQPQPLQVAAAEALCHLHDPQLTGLLLDRWRTYTNPAREAVLAAFFAERWKLLALLDAIRQEKVQAWALSRGRRSQLLRSSDPEIRRRAEALLARVSDDRKAVFDRYRPSLRMAGDPQRGQQVFRENCGQCHKIGNLGHEVGPDLLGVVTRPKEMLLNDILIPNQNIEDGYEEYLLETTDGRRITGVMARQTASTVTLRRAQGEEDTVLRRAIADLRSLNVSPMPEDLEKKISVGQMADLLAYIKSLR